MAQSEIIELLEKQTQPLSVGEIARLLGAVPTKISRDLNKLIQYHEVMYKEVDTKTAMEKYKCKRRMRIYFMEGRWEQ
jgi:predicted transcriptional regulator